MTFGLREHDVAAVVLDIEGTTTPVAFVYDVLFPYARAHLRESLDTLEAEVLREPVRRLREEWLRETADDQGPRTTDQGLRANDQIAGYVEWLMDRDRKSPGLKLLQGRIWEAGYRAHELRAEVFSDVPSALERWRRLPVEIAIYSSGSQLAQRLLFAHTACGDLTRFISHFFDTDIGAKLDAASYARIAQVLDLRAQRLLFVSDTSAELAAATAAGCQVLMSRRPGNREQPEKTSAVIETFDEIV